MNFFNVLIREISIWKRTENTGRGCCGPVENVSELMEGTLGEGWLRPHISDCYSVCFTFFSIIICSILIFYRCLSFSEKNVIKVLESPRNFCSFEYIFQEIKHCISLSLSLSLCIFVFLSSYSYIYCCARYNIFVVCFMLWSSLVTQSVLQHIAWDFLP
jgi:hypothetical protein